MALLVQAKTLGGVGSILVLLTIVPLVGPFLGIVGFILVLIAIKYLSDLLNDRSIFNNMLIAVILGIAGVAAGALVGFAEFFGFRIFMVIDIVPDGRDRIIRTALIVLAILWVSMVISAIFLRRSFDSLAKALNVRLFGTTALLYLVGAVLIIAFGIGLIVILVAEILQTIAFFSIPEQRPEAPPPPPPPSTTTP